MRSGALFSCLPLILCGCPTDETEVPPEQASFGIVHADLPGALLSVWGTSESDVWVVGGDALDDSGPMVLHYDGDGWQRLTSGQTQGDLWWVFGFAGGPIYMGGSGGVILRYEGGAFTLMPTPDTGTVFGIWGASPDDVWAVGGTLDKNGFAWRLAGDSWVAEASLPPLPDAAIWKIFGTSADNAWLVGSGGVSFHWNGTALAQADTGVGNSLFTVHANAHRFVAVGGLASGFIVENDGSGWTLAADSLYGLTGVCITPDDGGYSVGQYGSIYAREAGQWREVDHRLELDADLHGVWLDPAGGVWAAGGRTASFPLIEGVLLYKGERVVEGGI